MKLGLAVVAALCATVAPTAAARADLAPNVTVRLATGQTAPVAVDLSMAGCVLTQAEAARLHLPAIGDADPPRVLAQGAALDGVALGDLDCKVGTRSVLGGDVFAGLVLRLDGRSGALSVHGGAQKGRDLTGPHARLIHAQALPDGRLAIPVRLNGARGLGLIAPGESRSSVNAVLRTRAGTPVRGGVDTLDLAGFTLEVSPQTREGADPAVSGVPVIRLGQDALRGFSLVLDYPYARIWVDPQG